MSHEKDWSEVKSIPVELLKKAQIGVGCQLVGQAVYGHVRRVDTPPREMNYRFDLVSCSSCITDKMSCRVCS
jgi:hypothetical protein